MPTEATEQQLLTVAAIAARLGQPKHRIRYVISSRKITPAFRAGAVPIFTEADVAHIAAEIIRLDAERNRL